MISRMHHVPSEKAIIRSLSMMLSDSSRKRPGRNCCGCCQSSGSMCALYRLIRTCIHAPNNTAVTVTSLVSIIYYTRVCEVAWLSLEVLDPIHIPFLPRDALVHSEIAFVCPSVCLSVTIRYRDDIGWNSSKITSRPNSLRPLLWLTPTWAIWFNGNMGKFGGD